MKQKGGVTALEEDDFILVQKALQGDDDAFSLLFQRYHSFLYKYLLKLTLDEDLCSELCQEAMMKCYMNLSSYKNEAKFSTWMISIASRLYMDYLRKQKREKSSLQRIKQSLSHQLQWKAKYKGVEWSEMFSDFNELDSRFRIPVLLRHYYGYTYDEIAHMLNMRAGTVKSRVNKGVNILRKEWKE